MCFADKYVEKQGVMVDFQTAARAHARATGETTFGRFFRWTRNALAVTSITLFAGTAGAFVSVGDPIATGIAAAVGLGMALSAVRKDRRDREAALQSCNRLIR